MKRDPAQMAANWFAGWKAKDAAAIERMMHADYVYVAPNGAVMSRDAILGIIRDPSYAITDGGHSEVIVTLLGADVAIVRHHWRGRGRLRGQEFDDDHRCVMIWHRVAGEWSLRFEQASPVAPA
jgi:ketosteroid isomerase-like protein